MDTSFTIGSGLDSSPYAIHSYSDNKILLSGSFTSYNNQTSSQKIILLGFENKVVNFLDYNGDIIATQSVIHGTTVTPPAALTREGYTFTGWSPADLTNITANTNFVAQYSINQYTLTFDSNGGSAVAPITQDFSSAIVAPANPTRVGYTFTGWSPALPVTMPAANVIYTAQYTQNPTTESNNGNSTSNGISYTCKDTKATNYSAFGRHKPSLCKYGSTTTPTESNPFGGTQCPSNQLITDNMKNGDTNDVYSSYNKGKVTQISILQAHINRLLQDKYTQAAGPVDNYFRSKTKQGVERIQRKLNQLLPNMKPLVIDGIVGPFTKEAINMSC